MPVLIWICRRRRWHRRRRRAAGFALLKPAAIVCFAIGLPALAIGAGWWASGKVAAQIERQLSGSAGYGQAGYPLHSAEAQQPIAVPEPSSLALLVPGLVVLFRIRRRKRRITPARTVLADGCGAGVPHSLRGR